MADLRKLMPKSFVHIKVKSRDLFRKDKARPVVKPRDPRAKERKPC